MKDSADADADKSVKDFAEQLAESFDKKNDGYYKFKEFLRHVLYEYECSLAEKHGINKIPDVKELFSNDRGAKISIEHIFPQTPTAYWDKVFEDFKPADKYALKNSLGNLLLLSQKINSSVQNDEYDAKRTRYKNNSHSAIEVAQNQQWTATEIRDRSEKIINFIAAHWGLNFTPEQKSQLIHLDFGK